MHEVSIMESVLETVFSNTEVSASPRITGLRLRIGSLSSVVEESLRFAFDSLCMGTKAEGAELVVDHVQTEYQCSRCSCVYAPDNPGALCPKCGSTDVCLIHGREIEIISVEVDD